MNPGDILDGRYRIDARLGAGGMGEVYKATHTFLGAPRVIKVIHPHIAANTDAQDRFLREARVATKVQHQNVATLHDFASLPDGSHYMVWELIDGENLAERLRTRGTLPPRQAIDIAIQALHGVEAIHRAGIVHRDISPENLMITRDGVVKIIDLGVAKMDDPDAVSQTRTGIFVGKLRYAAPEQLGFLPENERIDGRADLYALAMVVVELLTGRPPYEAKSPHEYFLHHAREVTQTTVTLPPQLPGSEALQKALEKALARDRNERFADAGAFAAALQEIARTLPDAASTATVETPAPLDLDATWRPSQGVKTTVRTPLPAPAPVAAEATVQTPLPPYTPPPPAVATNAKRSVWPVLLVILLAIVLIGGGAAFALWPTVRPMLSGMIATPTPTPQPKVPAKQQVTTPAPTPAQATIQVAPPAPTATIAEATKPAPVHEHKSPPQQLSAPAKIVSTYDDVPPPQPQPKYNDHAMQRLHDELRGVHEVALLAGAQQTMVYRAIHRYVPDLTFDADAPVVIKWDATSERLGIDGRGLAASATISKNGRVIFVYDIPYGDSQSAAYEFAQKLADAMEP
jgi:eukaryotic-like serine/threonine-protein kinase